MGHPNTATWKLFDLAAGGAAEAWLTARRAGGDSYDAIAHKLAEEFDIDVSREWVRQHCQRLSKAA